MNGIGDGLEVFRRARRETGISPLPVIVETRRGNMAHSYVSNLTLFLQPLPKLQQPRQ